MFTFTEFDFLDFVPGALNGTLNVLKSAASNNDIKRIVLTSSMASVAFNGGALPSDHVYSEKDWSSEEYMRSSGHWYALSKTLAERAAWDFVEEQNKSDRGLELVTINPTLVTGPMLQSTVNASNDLVKQILDGKKEEIPNSSMGFVDVRDVASSHVLAYEKGTHGTRYICMTAAEPWKKWYAALRACAKDPSKIPTKLSEDAAKPPMQFDNSKLTDLGWSPVDLDTSLRDTVATMDGY